MLKREKEDLCTEIGQELGLPINDTVKIVNKFLEKVRDRVGRLDSYPEYGDILSGIPTIDLTTKLLPGVTMVYSPPDGGRTSLAKRIAVSGAKQGLNVVYYDTENKLMHHDTSIFSGICLATPARAGGITELYYSGLVDLMVVDTVTGLPGTTQGMMTQLRRKVPYLIVITQMRNRPKDPMMSPATTEDVMSSAHCMLYLTGKEKITIEGVSVTRVQYMYTKYEPDDSVKGTRGSFIIRNNIIDPLYTAYDYLRSSGLVRSVGRCKFLRARNEEEIKLGSITEASSSKEGSELILTSWMKEVGLDLPVEVYIG